MGTVRCKFRCDVVTRRAVQDGNFEHQAEFSAVVGGSDENKEFFRYTPSGSLKVGTYKENHFTPGKEYYIDIVEAAGEAAA